MGYNLILKEGLVWCGSCPGSACFSGAKADGATINNIARRAFKAPCTNRAKHIYRGRSPKTR
jgi:hypothetical protein